MRSRDSQFSQFATRKRKLLLRKLVVLNLYKKSEWGFQEREEKLILVSTWRSRVLFSLETLSGATFQNTFVRDFHCDVK